MHRGIRVLATLACAALLATACSGDGDGDGAAGEADPQGVSGEVVFWDTSGENEQPVFEQLIADFEEQYPDVTVKHEPVPFGEAENKFKTAAQSGNAPDVLRSDVGWTPGFVELRDLEPLDGTPAADGLDDFLESTTASVTADDRVYGIPQVTDAMALMYNKQLLEQAGVAEPPTTWDELAQAAARIEAATGVTGFAINGNDPYHLLPYIYGNGGQMVTADGEVTINAAEAVGGIQVQLELAGQPGVARDITQNAYANVNNAGFQEGQVAMVVNGPWFLGDLESAGVFADAPDNLGIAPLPGSGGEGQSPIGGHNYVVYAGSEVKDAAFAFIKFMSTTESQTLLATELGLFPTRASAYEEPAVAEDPHIQAFKPLVDAAHARPPFAGDFLTPLQEQFARELAPADAQAAADTVAQAYEELVSSGS